VKLMVNRRTFAVFLIAALQVANAQSDGIPNDLAQAILNELRQIRILLERQQQKQPQTALTAPAAVPEKAIISAGGYSLGQNDAPLTLVEFADYQCPYCKQFHATVFDRLKKNYIDTGKLRFVSRDLPLDMHPDAFRAAQAARCAGDQSNFWQMRELLIAHADNLAAEAVVTYARQLDLDLERFRSCLDSGKYLPSIREDMADAGSAGIYGTPTFVLGRTSGSSVEGMKIVGAQPYESFEKMLTEYPAK
jgi:protein-disulfide isomerase